MDYAKILNSSSLSQRRRGRPKGTNRIPFSIDERRARNAYYEKERRTEMAKAMVKLAEAISCDANSFIADILVLAISHINESRQRSREESVDNLVRINRKLEAQIEILTARLRKDNMDIDQPSGELLSLTSSTAESEDNNSFNIVAHQPQIKKPRNRKKRISMACTPQNIYNENQEKSKSESSADSGVDVRSHYSDTLSNDEDIINKQTVSPAIADIQSQLYHELFNSGNQSLVQTVAQDTLSDQCMKILTHSLFEIPPILSKTTLNTEQQKKCEQITEVNTDTCIQLTTENELVMRPTMNENEELLTSSIGLFAHSDQQLNIILNNDATAQLEEHSEQNTEGDLARVPASPKPSSGTTDDDKFLIRACLDVD